MTDLPARPAMTMREIRTALGHKIEPDTEPVATRTLTVEEHDRAWHAIEGATGEPDADPGTVLAAVLHALRINPPTAADEEAYILRKRTASRATQPPSKSHEELKAECLAAMADADIASHPSRI